MQPPRDPSGGMKKAAERWRQHILESMAGARRERKMAPWEEQQWFDVPVETTFTMDGTAIQVSRENPQRVVLIIGTANGNTLNLSTNRSGLGVNAGFILNTDFPSLMLEQARHGPLAQMAWFAFGIAGTGCTALEVVLRDWPKGA